MNKPTVCVIGLGYIGLPTATLIASNQIPTTGVDVNPAVITALEQGKIIIHEPGLAELVAEQVKSGTLSAVARPVASDVFIIAVPTPFKEGKKPDMTYVEDAARAVAPVLKPGSLVILESTSPPGSTAMVAEILAKSRPDLNIAGQKQNQASEEVYVAYCPERVLPGRILEELVGNDRIAGGIDRESTRKAAEFYRRFVKGSVLETDALSAELSKLAENSFRDVNIAYANELAAVCEELGANPWEVIKLANRHPRVNILNPGPGVGGHCIAVDPWFIVHATPETARLIKTAREINDNRPKKVVADARRKLETAANRTVACFGLAFKPDVDDLRESPAVEIVAELAAAPNVEILAVEPYIRELPAALKKIPNIKLVDLDEALARADLGLLLVDHVQFKENAEKIAAMPVVIDTRGLFQKGK